jgi:hypothetical protein
MLFTLALHVLECFVFCFHFCFVVATLWERLGSSFGVLFHSLWKLETSWRLVLLRACARPSRLLVKRLEWDSRRKRQKWVEREKVRWRKKEGRKCGFSLVWREQRRQWQQGLLEEKILVAGGRRRRSKVLERTLERGT